MEKKRLHTHTYIKLNHFAVQQKLARHCKLAMIQKKRKRNYEKIKHWHSLFFFLHALIYGDCIAKLT